MLFPSRKRKRLYSKFTEAEKENCSTGHINHGFTGSMDGSMMDCTVDDCGLSPIHQLARVGDKKKLKELSKSCKSCRTSNFLRLKSKCGSAAAHFAAEHGHVDLLGWIYKYDRLTLDQEDERGMTPFLVAVENGQYDCLKYIIKQTDADVLATNYKSQNAIHIASQMNRMECFRLLVSIGCPPNAHDYVGSTPLHVATQFSHTSAVCWLLKNTKLSGMEVDDMGSTPLHLACELGQLTLVRVFVRSGVPLTSEDNECRTPEIVAQMYNQPDVLRVLEEERKRLRLIEDVGPYVGSLARRDKRRRPDVKRDSFQHKAKDFSPPPRMSKDSGSKGKASGAEFMSKTRDFTSRTRDSAALSSSANSLESQGLKRSHTVCASGSGDIHSYLRSKCSRDIASSRDDGISFKRHSKSTFDSGFESGLSDILDEILGGANYDPVLEESASPKTKWQSFKGKLIEAFAKSKKSELNDSGSDSSEVKATKWDKLQQFVKVKVAKVSHQDLDMGGFEDAHWRTLEPRQFHRGTRKTQSFVKWNRGGSR